MKPSSAILGLASLAIYGLHVAYYVRRGAPENVLWACHVATVLTGLGLLLRSATLNAIGFLWLVLGLPTWLFYLADGGEMLLTSVLTHFAGPAIGYVGMRRLGLPRLAWLAAVGALVVLHVICRFATSPAENVNLAHAIFPGFERYFPSHLVYIVCGFAFSGAVFAATQLAMRRLGLEEQPA